MIPSLVVTELREALVEYLATTFALSDDETRDALSEFLTKEGDGIFRGPYLSVRTPFQHVADDWKPQLEWLPDDFVPYAHQAESFQRLSSVGGRQPEPTLVTTGTGSGKTECFLYPVLDHCAGMRDEGRLGIKALILYPMNALASDQAGRLAELIAGETRLAGLTAGLYVGEAGRNSTMGPDHVIDKREAIRADPPDILLTNYKMLDFLLLRNEDRELWAGNDSDTLQYVVLDEFHTYDGAQGTDVAMLLRRLGATLGAAEPGRPLGNATPVATSATLGTGASAGMELAEFAGKVFGVEFAPESVIGESRQSVDAACEPVNYELPIPDVDDVLGLTDLDDVANAFCVSPDGGGDWSALGTDDDARVRLGRRLLAHPLTWAVLSAVGERPRSWPEAVKEIVFRAPNWGRTHQNEPLRAEQALAQFLWLLSEARRRRGARLTPLFSVEIQLWIREVSRLLRKVQATPSFRWRDSSAPVSEDDTEGGDTLELPSTYCRQCGMSGWMAIASETSDALSTNAGHIYRSSVQGSPLARTMLVGHPDDEAVRWFSPIDHTLSDTRSEDALPVLVTDGEDDARAGRCPGCKERDAIRFLGLRVASLASVSINTLFGSNHLESQERKLLAFTDSVQDASHRASFFGGRTHRFNLRALMSRALIEDGEMSLAELGETLLDEATTPRDVFSLVPPDLLRHPVVRTVWTDAPKPRARELLAARLGFEVDLEFGLRARVGRTLELSRAAAAAVVLPDIDDWASLVAEEAQRVSGEAIDPLAAVTYVRGLLERLRLKGGLMHPLLTQYLDNGGDTWFIWGGRPDGLPPFTSDRGRPTFFTTSPKGTLDSLSSLSTTPTWVVDWAVRSLGVAPALGRDLNLFTMKLLANETDTVVAWAGSGHTIYGLDRRMVTIGDVADAEEAPLTASTVRCGICGHLHVAPPSQLEAWEDTPCLRYRCSGRFEALEPREINYYRDLYRGGNVTRVVTGEHTGLLRRAPREDLEAAFKAGTAADAPNVLTATPTLEMGIDIGDLSSVMLTSVPRNPASYIQRVGRSGRASGNSLITTFVPTDTHGLYYLADPEAMLAGDVRPPNCYLDALEILQRQYVAYLIDRIADGTIVAPKLPRQIGQLMKAGVDVGSFLRAAIDASIGTPAHVEAFLGLFDDADRRSTLSDRSVAALREFAGAGIEVMLKEAAGTWQEHAADLRLRLQRLTNAADKLEGEALPSDETSRELADLRGQRSALALLARQHREEYTLSALERRSVLPNFMLMDDSITLSATTWARDDDGDYETTMVEYQRPGRRAITELAPGNSFYAAGHRHVIDALEIGTADSPAYEQWRLCPDCGYGCIDEGEPPAECLRCKGRRIADTGAIHRMLRLKRSMASGSEESARVYDETDDRRREQYDSLLAVDVDPHHVEGAWALANQAFGAEFAAGTHFRTINLGFAHRSGEKRHIAGHDHHVTGFTVCAHCGAVREVRDRSKNTPSERLHEGWCKVRSGAKNEQWDDVVLFHELTTESIRMLLPVSMFEVSERLASFKGALLLGLRADFGGDPSHLEVALTDAPNRAGQGRRRYLMLFDAVPGGTGYLARLAEPDRVRTILERGRDFIARCPCVTEGRQACHRCLLGVVDRNEYELARRDLALEILDDLLGEATWDPQKVDTVAHIEIGTVEESELERRFKAALRAWAASLPDTRVSLTDVPGHGRYKAFELRMETGDDPETSVRTHYRIEEQEGLGTSPSVLPDFLIRRLDTRAPNIAVFLDGYQFHASPEVNSIAADAQKRRGIRDNGDLVWNLTWNDVKTFHSAFEASPPTKPAARNLITGEARRLARQVQQGQRGRFEVDDLNQNPMKLLLDVMARPDFDEWSQLAMSGIGGMFASTEPKLALGAADGEEFLGRAARGSKAVTPSGDGGAQVAFAARADTPNGLSLALALDTRPGREQLQRWTVLAALPDSARDVSAEGHAARWQDWVQWANVAQLMGGPGRHALITATSEAEDLSFDLLWLVNLDQEDDAASSVAAIDGAAAPDGEEEALLASAGEVSQGDVTISEEMNEELELVEDDNVRELTRRMLMRGAPDFEAGYELGGEPVEAAWPDRSVGVLGADQADVRADGWDLRPVSGWTDDALLDAVGMR